MKKSIFLLLLILGIKLNAEVLKEEPISVQKKLELAKVYEKHGEYVWAGHFYKEIGDANKAQEMYTKAAKKEEENGHYEQASIYYESAGNEEEARKFDIKVSRMLEAKSTSGDGYASALKFAKIAKDVDSYRRLSIKAAQQYEREGTYVLAARYYGGYDEPNSKRMYLKAAQEEEQHPVGSFSFQNAAEYYEKINEKGKAIEMYIKGAQWDELDELYNHAYDFYKKAGDLALKYAQEISLKIKK